MSTTTTTNGNGISNTPLPPVTIKPGILNLPGSTLASKVAAEKALALDNTNHHCYFRPLGLHNHLSHHILAAFDLGATPELIEAIYEDEKKLQRPIMLDGEKEMQDGLVERGFINEGNWKKWVGDQKAYGAYVTFFTNETTSLGVKGVLDRYIFSDNANESGGNMLIRLMSGALHPFIQLGYAIEFGSDPNLVGEALAQAAIHNDSPLTKGVFEYTPPSPASKSKAKYTLFDVLEEIYESKILEPVLPYDPDALYSKRTAETFSPPSKRSEELARVCSLWSLPGEEGRSSYPLSLYKLKGPINEAILASTLLLTSSGKKGYKPRLDFFLMHGLTSAAFLPTFLDPTIHTNADNQRKLLRHWWSVVATIIILRGRPRVDCERVMEATAVPLPKAWKNKLGVEHPGALGETIGCVNSWPLIIGSALRAPDSHTTKAIRTLLYGAKVLGWVGKAGFLSDPEAWSGRHIGLETNGPNERAGDIFNLAKLDGTVFLRAAGMVLDTLGWVDWGEGAGEWDRSALGWDAAWEGDKKVDEDTPHLEDTKVKKHTERRLSYVT